MRHRNLSVFIFTVAIGLTFHTSVLAQVTNAGTDIPYQEQLVDFLNNPKMKRILYRKETISAFSGIGISMIDISGDGVPEVIVRELKPFMSSTMGTATAYDIGSCNTLIDFNVGLASEGDSIRCYKDLSGQFRCIVTETLDKMHGRLDTVITEITTQNGEFEIQTKYLFQCTRDYGANNYSQYSVFEDLTKEETIAYRKVPYLESDTHVPVSVYHYIQYMNGLSPVDSAWVDIGHFIDGQFTASAGFEGITEKLKSTE